MSMREECKVGPTSRVDADLAEASKTALTFEVKLELLYTTCIEQWQDPCQDLLREQAWRDQGPTA